MNPAGSEEHDPSVDELSRLARRSLTGDAPRREEASFARVGDKIVRLKRRRAALTAAGTAALVVALLIGAGAFLSSGPRSLTYSVMNGAVVDGDRVVAGAETTVRFSDGSELTLERGAETHIDALDAHGGRVVLDEGTASVAIAKRPSAVWMLSAGPYQVRVTGTRFSLRWSKRERRFEIAMQSGSVVVSGPMVPAGMALAAGQRLRTSASGDELTLDQASTLGAEGVSPRLVGVGSSAVSEPPTAAPGQDVAPDSAAVAPSVASATVSAPPASLDWQKRAAAGEFAAVIAAAEARGLEATLASASLEDLAALADSARYARRNSLAKRVLLAERKRFPVSRTARDAAFFLARLAEDEGEGALEWYDRYLSESPRGTYASQALGRKMLLVHAQQGSDAARPLAAEYLSRYPNGPYAASAQKISDASPNTP
jgi:hypothetical protein